MQQTASLTCFVVPHHRYVMLPSLNHGKLIGLGLVMVPRVRSSGSLVSVWNAYLVFKRYRQTISIAVKNLNMGWFTAADFALAWAAAIPANQIKNEGLGFYMTLCVIITYVVVILLQFIVQGLTISPSDTKKHQAAEEKAKQRPKQITRIQAGKANIMLAFLVSITLLIKKFFTFDSQKNSAIIIKLNAFRVH